MPAICFRIAGESLKVIKAEYFLQSLTAFFHNRKMVQRKMRDQAPLQALPQRGAQGMGWLAQASRFDQRHAFGLELAEFARQLQTRGLVAVGAGHSKCQHVHRRERGFEIQIDKREINLSSVVVLAKGRAPMRIPERFFALLHYRDVRNRMAGRLSAPPRKRRWSRLDQPNKLRWLSAGAGPE